MRARFVAFLLLLSACAADPNRTYLQGIWVGVGEGSAGSGQSFVQWQFSRGGFIFQQEIREGELLVSQGSYRVLESEGEVLMVELFEISGDVFTYNNQPVVYRIVIDRDGGKLEINSRVYERVE